MWVTGVLASLAACVSAAATHSNRAVLGMISGAWEWFQPFVTPPGFILNALEDCASFRPDKKTQAGGLRAARVRASYS
jgi:hypothetical protein